MGFGGVVVVVLKVVAVVEMAMDWQDGEFACFDEYLFTSSRIRN